MSVGTAINAENFSELLLAHSAIDRKLSYARKVMADILFEPWLGWHHNPSVARLFIRYHNHNQVILQAYHIDFFSRERHNCFVERYYENCAHLGSKMKWTYLRRNRQ